MKKEEIVLSKYRPNILILIGVIFNIIFASIFSLFWITMIITIPAIVFNALLLVPRTQVKRYWAVWRVVPVALSLILSIFMFISLFFGAVLVEHIYLGLAQTVNTVAFWTKDAVMKTEVEWARQTKEILSSVFLVIGLAGNILIMCGWYSKKELGALQEVKKEEKKKDAK